MGDGLKRARAAARRTTPRAGEVERIAKLLWAQFVAAGVWGPDCDWDKATSAEQRPFHWMARAVLRDRQRPRKR